MSIKAKVGSTFHTVKPSVNINGNWRPVIKGYVKVGDVWELSYEHEFVYTFAPGTYYDVDLDLLTMDRSYNVKVIIPSNVTILASSTAKYALRTGTNYVAALTIENNGTILGHGGAGGAGGATNAGYHGVDGGDGGHCIYIERAVSFDNNSIIKGGGGGGGGGGAAFYNAPWYESDDRVGGSGGGGGAPYGAGASGGSPSGNSGAAATLTTAGLGGLSRRVDDTYGGYGGNGGAYLTAGSAGGSPTGYVSTGGTPGAAGAAGEDYFNPQNYQIILL